MDAVSGRRLLWLGAAAAVLLIVLALLVGVLVGSSGAPASPGSAQPEGAPRPTSSLDPAPASLAPAAPTPTAAPATELFGPCSDLFSADMVSEIEPLQLNPSWVQSDPSVSVGTRDTQLASMLASLPHQTCVWAPADGPGEDLLTTNLTKLSGTEQDRVSMRLESAGYSCYDELSGMRCVTEATTDAGTVGESHFIRDGVWIATLWVNIEPSGYTHDIVDHVFS